MRILFHADLSHGQAQAVWRCRYLLTAMGIDLEHADNPKTTASFFCDLNLVHSSFVEADWIDAMLNSVTPIRMVILERIDGAQLTGPVRKHIGHPNLVGVIKNTVYGDLLHYNLSHWRGHELICREAMRGSFKIYPDEFLQNTKWITPASCAKLHLGPSFAMYGHADIVRNNRPLKPLSARTVDVSFVGTTEYGPEVAWLNWHRGRAVAAVQGLKSGNNVGAAGRPMQFGEYFRLMENTRIAVSPWGLGEPAFRDWEAALCGCVIIKPDTSYIETTPVGFYSHPAFVTCRPDFSDLPEAVERAREVPQDAVDDLRAQVLKSCEPAVFAARLEEVFRKAVAHDLV